MAVSTVERIQLVLETLIKGFGRGIDSANKKLRTVGKNMENFGQVMEMPVKNVGELNNRFKVMQSTGGRVAKRFRDITHGMRGFRMEALGVLFFGIAMQQMFMGLLQPVLDAFGVFELFRLMLLTLFLPIMEDIFEPMLKIMKWFMELDEPVQKAIGIFTLFGVALSSVLAVIATLALGIGSLIQFFPFIGTAIKAVGAFFTGLGVTALAVVAAIVAVVIGMKIAWDENFLDMRNTVKEFFRGVKLIFGGLFRVVTGIVNLLIAIVTGDFEKLKSAIKTILLGIFDFFVGVFVASFRFVQGVITGIVQLIFNVFKLLIEGATRVINFFSNLFGFGNIFEGSISGVAGVNAAASEAIGGGGEVINITNNFSGFTNDDLKRELDDRDKRNVEEVRRVLGQ